MKKIWTIIGVLLVAFLLTNTSNATGLLTEDFNYTAGDSITAHGWAAHSGSGGIAITSPGLTYSGYLGSGVGNATTVNNSTSVDVHKNLSSSVSSGSVYASAMINITTAAATNTYFFHFGSGSTSFTAKLFAKADGAGFDFGITKASNTATTWTTTCTYGNSYLVVIKYSYVTGTGNDVVDLFLNPTPGGSEPSPTITAGDPTGTDFGTIQGIYLRQSSGIPTAIVDGIKVGTAWADVTPSSGGSATFSVNGTLSAFSQTSASPSAEQTYTINGTNLTNTVTVTPPSGFEISKTTGAGFVNSTSNLTFSAAQVMANPTIYVRLHAVSSGGYSGNITHASSDFTTVNQPVTGTNTSKCTLSLTALIQARYSGSIMIPDTVDVELRNESTLALVDQDRELLSASGVGTFTFSSAVNGTNYYLVVKHRNSVETWSASAQSFSSYALIYDFTTISTQAYGSNLILQDGKYCLYSGDVNQDGFVTGDDFAGVDNDGSNFEYHLVNDLNGDGFVTGDDFTYIDNNGANFISINKPTSAPTSVLNVTGTLASFTQTSATPSGEQTYNIGGTSLTANVTIVPPTGFEISKTTSSGFVTSSGSLVYTAAEVMAGKTIYVRLHAGSPGSYSGDITHTSGNAEFAQVNKAVSGSYTITPVFSITGSLTSFTQTSASPSAEQTYNIGGSDLTANVTLAPPAGFEISKTTNTGFVTSIGSLVYTAAEVMAGKIIYVRLHAGSAGSYSGSITHTSASSEFTQVTKSVSGTYVVVSSNVNLIMGNPTFAVTLSDSIHNYLLDKPQFCASYDRDRRIANWTSWQLNSTWLTDNSTRNDPYRVDPTLPAGWPQVGSGYNYSTYGFDRGHLCPSADRVNTQTDNDALFVMTNLIPQNPTNNQGVWATLETYERTLVSQGNVVYILTGGWGTGGTSAEGSFNTITASNGVTLTVPAKLWKVMIVVPNGSSTADDVARVDTTTRTIAVIMNNDQGPFGTWQSYRVSVDSVEALTGYDFFSNVSPSIQAVIEAKVDNQ
jgi:endonuclease G, mitochondrial